MIRIATIALSLGLLGSQLGCARKTPPSYMRIHMLDSATGGNSYPDPIGDSISVDFPLSDCDIDVSYDKANWYHLFGAECVRHLKAFR